LPLTGKGVVDMLITEKAVFTKIDGRLVLKEVAKGLTIDDIKKCTGYSFETVQNVEEF
jgi:acyl CoA:acetate/3-ketoacid CoA transferase beta subunit